MSKYMNYLVRLLTLKSLSGKVFGSPKMEGCQLKNVKFQQGTLINLIGLENSTKCTVHTELTLFRHGPYTNST